MPSRSVIEVVVVLVAVVLVMHAVAAFLATSTPYLVAVVLLAVIVRLVWFYTR
jgi:hypothetical protein